MHIKSILQNKGHLSQDLMVDYAQRNKEPKQKR